MSIRYRFVVNSVQHHHRKARWSDIILAVVVLECLSFSFAEECDHPFQVPCDVTVGVRVWDYSRIYPLLDGLFQDVAAIQVKQLQMDPSAANGTSLDPLQQVFRLQAGYSATLGIQNTLAAQQASAGSASAILQAQLIGRQSQLIQSQLLAQSQIGVAQSVVDELSSNGAKRSSSTCRKLGRLTVLL